MVSASEGPVGARVRVRGMTVCEWFLLCTNEATGVVHHPARRVPCCDRCAGIGGVELHPFDCGCDRCVPDLFDTNEEARGER